MRVISFPNSSSRLQHKQNFFFSPFFFFFFFSTWLLICSEENSCQLTPYVLTHCPRAARQPVCVCEHMLSIIYSYTNTLLSSLSPSARSRSSEVPECVPVCLPLLCVCVFIFLPVCLPALWSQATRAFLIASSLLQDQNTVKQSTAVKLVSRNREEEWKVFLSFCLVFVRSSQSRHTCVIRPHSYIVLHTDSCACIMWTGGRGWRVLTPA